MLNLPLSVGSAAETRHRCKGPADRGPAQAMLSGGGDNRLRFAWVQAIVIFPTDRSGNESIKQSNFQV